MLQETNIAKQSFIWHNFFFRLFYFSFFLVLQKHDMLCASYYLQTKSSSNRGMKSPFSKMNLFYQIAKLKLVVFSINNNNNNNNSYFFIQCREKERQKLVVRF
jgi:hypothetical protein